MPVTVKWGREKISFDLPPPNTPLGSVRKSLADYTQLPEHAFKLIHAGAVMKDDTAPISSYNLHPNSTIALIGSSDPPPSMPGQSQASKAQSVPKTEQSTISLIQSEISKVRTELTPSVDSFLNSLQSPPQPQPPPQANVYDQQYPQYYRNQPTQPPYYQPQPFQPPYNQSTPYYPSPTQPPFPQPQPPYNQPQPQYNQPPYNQPYNQTPYPQYPHPYQPQQPTYPQPYYQQPQQPAYPYPQQPPPPPQTQPAQTTPSQEKEHTRLGELLLQSLLRLDAITTDGEWEDARRERKSAVNEVQALLDRLDGGWRSRGGKVRGDDP